MFCGAKAGNEVILFDGSGAEFVARIRQVGRKEVELEILQQRDIDRELPFRLTLAVALPKGERHALARGEGGGAGGHWWFP